ncbi:ferritin-like domain-containing protein [Collybia nuda]|uniref:Ferritin-like domain-containing protein n=1 Tax=Collybia nuda TaxID=64659 RepID=A0A9P5XZW6_9AGAR|nr:ferritin-like domain-containing protein [Collybia nuda]
MWERPSLLVGMVSQVCAILKNIEILNFALTLEHLEAAFYKQGLMKYSKKAFKKAGHPGWVRGRFQQIAEHEKAHVQFLTSAITAAGAQAVEACEYQFPDTDPNSFIDTAYALESVGVSAYNGAAAFINNKAYLTVAASILGVEARHSAWINSAARNSNPWSTAFETPLDLNQVFSIASGFIKKCPNSNPPLPVKAFPSLVVSNYSLGKPAHAKFDCKGQKGLFAAFLLGTGTIFTPIKDGIFEIDIPKELKCWVYVVVTNDGGKVSDETIVAGPAILNFPCGA